MTQDWRSWAGLALLTVSWGSAFLINAIALRELDPVFTTGARILLAAVTMAAVARAVAGPLPRARRFWGWSLPIGLFALVGSYGGYTWAQLETPSGVAAIYVAATPLFTVALSRVFTDERVSRRGLAGFVIGFAGVALLIGPEALAGLGGAMHEMAALGSALSFAAGAVLVRRAPGFHPLHGAAGALIMAALVMAPAVAWTAPAAAPSWPAVAAVAALGVAQTSVAQILRFYLIRRAGALFTAQSSYLMPVWAVLLGWIFLDERLGLPDGAALALIVAGVALTQWRTRDEG